MSDKEISKIKIEDTTYNIKDAEARKILAILLGENNSQEEDCTDETKDN